MTTNLKEMTTAELTAMITEATAELAAREGEKKPVRVAIQFGAYNQRRYGRPWIGKITSWPVGGKPEMEWGSFCGNDNGGEVEIAAMPGDVIRYGQKDHRGNNTSAIWAIVLADGDWENVDAAAARQAFDKRG